MAAMGKMRRRYAKAQMKRLEGGGSLVSDVERQTMEKGLQEGATAMLGAQQTQLGQAARAQTGGGAFQEQPFRQTQQDMASRSSEIAVRASGQQRLMEAQLNDQRKGAVQAEVAALHDINRQNATAALDTAKWFTELPAGALGDVLGSSGLFSGPT